MIQRRGFLSLVGAGVAGLMLPDTLIVEPAKLAVPVPAGFSAVTLKTVTEAISAEFERQMGGIRWVNRPEGFKVGDLNFNNQFMAQAAFPIGTTNDIHDRLVNPIAGLFANKCKHVKVKQFGNLHMPVSVVESVQAGQIRGTSWPYCIHCDNKGDCDECGRTDARPLYRFDILVAS